MSDHDGEAAFAALGGQLTGAEALDLVHATLCKYVVFPSDEAAVAVTLYVAATHAVTEMEFAPRMVLASPTKRCGKSRLLRIMSYLVARPRKSGSISAAAMARCITAENPPTFLLDESDVTFGKSAGGDEKNDMLRGLLDNGFERGWPYSRWNASTNRMEDMPTFAMAVLAGISDGRHHMPDTILDRSIIIPMRRKTPAEPVQKFRTRLHRDGVQEAGAHLAAWVEPNAARIGEAIPVMPDGLSDRAEDVWEALIAAADLAGGEWPERARSAARTLSGSGDEDSAESSLSLRLLKDLRKVFGDADMLHGETILDSLHKITEAPWGDYYGKPLQARDLARLLKPYGVGSRDVKIAGVNKRGYRREHLHDAWTRYLPPPEPDDGDDGEAGDDNGATSATSATSATTATPQVSDQDQVAGSTQLVLPATSGPSLTSAVAEVADVALAPPEACMVCGNPLDPALIAAGYTMHAGCGLP